MKKVKDLVDLVLSADLQNEGKNEFHKWGKSVCRMIAKQLQLSNKSFEIRSNKGGDAVLGEITLHGERIYIQLCVVDFGQNKKFMYRSCNGIKDYTGGINRWMRWDRLYDFEDACKEFQIQ